MQPSTPLSDTSRFALHAALGFGTALVDDGDDLTPAERRVLARALVYHLRLACTELGVSPRRSVDA